jgi:ribonuclease P protein component
MAQAENPLVPETKPDIERLKKRPDFLAAARGLNCARGAVVAQARHRADGSSLIRIGFTATRRIGGAVVRNRAKRRLREAARLIAPLHARPGCDYVFIARGGTASRPWAPLLDDMKSALIRLAAELSASLGEPPPQRLLTRPD